MRTDLVVIGILMCSVRPEKMCFVTVLGMLTGFRGQLSDAVGHSELLVAFEELGVRA